MKFSGNERPFHQRKRAAGALLHFLLKMATSVSFVGKAPVPVNMVAFALSLVGQPPRRSCLHEGGTDLNITLRNLCLPGHVFPFAPLRLA